MQNLVIGEDVIRKLKDNKGRIWYGCKDVARTLGYVNVAKAVIVHVDAADTTLKRCEPAYGKGGRQTTLFMNPEAVIQFVEDCRVPDFKKTHNAILEDAKNAIR